MNNIRLRAALGVAAAWLVGACNSVTAPQDSPPTTARSGAPALACDALAQAFQWPNSRVLTNESLAEGTAKPSGITTPVPASAGGAFGLDPQAHLDEGHNSVQQLTPVAQALLAPRVLARCDALDGLADGMVSEPQAGQRVYYPERDIPMCGPAGGAACMGAAQKPELIAVMGGPPLRDGMPFYAPLPWDSGLSGADWRPWQLSHSTGPRDALALSNAFGTPPVKVANDPLALRDVALGFDIDRDGPRIFACDGVYASSVMAFMEAPDLAGLKSFVARGGKLVAGHGMADPVFSALDTMAWVEQGKPPQAVLARARGAGSNLPYAERPAAGSPVQTRVLRPYPQVARYPRGDAESAGSFGCAP